MYSLFLRFLFQGLFNSIAYGLNSSVRQAISEDLKRKLLVDVDLLIAGRSSLRTLPDS